MLCGIDNNKINVKKILLGKFALTSYFAIGLFFTECVLGFNSILENITISLLTPGYILTINDELSTKK